MYTLHAIGSMRLAINRLKDSKRHPHKKIDFICQAHAISQGMVVQRLNNVTQGTNLYLMDGTVHFLSTHQLLQDSDLSIW